MKIFSTYQPMSKEYFELWTKRLDVFTPNHKGQPREDYHLASEKYSIFVVADGVTLKRDKDGNYPSESGAGVAAKIFCETVMHEAEKIYDIFTEKDLKELFSKGNSAVGEYNRSQGRIKENIDYREFDFFAVTASFLLIKEEIGYWWSIHDSGISFCDSSVNELFRSPELWSVKEKELIRPQDMTETEWNKFKKRTYRNKVGIDGDLIGYGVATGEIEAENYLNIGSMELKDRYLVFLFTDGFVNYISLDGFKSMFTDWGTDLEQKVVSFSEMKIEEDCALYGQERSIIAVRL